MDLSAKIGGRTDVPRQKHEHGRQDSQQERPPAVVVRAGMRLHPTVVLRHRALPADDKRGKSDGKNYGKHDE